MKRSFLSLLFALCALFASAQIDRQALVRRNCPHITSVDSLASLTVGNGEFAFTCDVTGLQTFPAHYSKGVPLGTQSQWGWHSFPNKGGYQASEVLRSFDFGRGAEEWYSCQLKDERGKAASDYLRANPHRLHLGVVGFAGMKIADLSDIDQRLDMWEGILRSSFKCQGRPVRVQTTCHPTQDRIVAQISDAGQHAVQFAFPYPTGVHSDDACDWSKNKSHKVLLVKKKEGVSVYRHEVDGQSYFIKIMWEHASAPVLKGNTIQVKPTQADWALSFEFTAEEPSLDVVDVPASVEETKRYWTDFWQQGGVVDFSHCTDKRARELERRVVLSQYLLAVQCAGSTPPQETGLTYNSWFGKFHLEMIWWHQAQFALWGHPELLSRTLPWYEKALPMAREIAKRQGFEGARWMKMTDPSAAEAPSNVGSFLIWQQPHLIYLCELLYRATADPAVVQRYASLVEETARFMASFATYDATSGRYLLKGCIPAQETLKAAETINPPFELSYWHFALSVAQQWRERQSLPRNQEWDKIIAQLSPLCAKEGVYAASEDSPAYPSLTADGIKLYSDHMAVLGACGVLPHSRLVDLKTMQNTLHWVMNNWNWDKTWGWDFPMTCMTAVRMGEPTVALEALLKDCRTNTYLPNGHNYQDDRLRCYLPGNGGLLTAVALMCAGYDGCDETLPGFPKDGSWDVRFEGIMPLPGDPVRAKEDWNEALYREIESRVVAPEFPDRLFPITRYGASLKASAAHNQQSINRAIEACSKAGGGYVVVPRGTWQTGAIRLLSNVNLRIEKDATLLFAFDPALYPLVQTRWEGLDILNYSPCVYAFEAENVAISGGGTLDGNGNRETWWPWCGATKYGYVEGQTEQSQSMPWTVNATSEGAATMNNTELASISSAVDSTLGRDSLGNVLSNRNTLLQMADQGVPVEKRIFGYGHGMRPQLVNFYACKNVLVEDVTMLRSPFWVLHPTLSRNVTVRRCQFINNGPNGDGCDPESCEDVLIEDCLFRTGDDCIAIKSGRNADGRRANRPSRNIIVRRCRMEDGHGGVVIGSEISAGVQNVFAHDCQMDSPNLDRVLRIKTNTCRGGIVEGIYMRDVEVGECREAVLRINLVYEPKERSQRGFYPVVRDVHMNRVNCHKSRYGILLNGLEDRSSIYNVSVMNCHFTGVKEAPIRITGKVHDVRVR